MLDQNYSSDFMVAANQSAKESSYWLKKLSGELVKSSFPCDEQIVSENQGKLGHGTMNIHFPMELASRLTRMSNRSDARLLVVLTAGVSVLLVKYTGIKDIIVGMPIFKQESESTFINTVVALRNHVQDGMTLKELLYQVKKTIDEAIQNQNYPLRALLYDLNLSYREGDSPLFDVAVMVENIQDKKYIQHIQPNIIFVFSRKEENLVGVIEYNRALYREETIQGIARHFILLVQNITANVDVPLHNIEWLSDDEKKKLLEDFNHTRQEYEGCMDKTLHRLFEDQVEKTPGNTALVLDGNKLSYREFNERSNKFSRLLKAKGYTCGSIAAILMESSIEMAISVLAVLKAGGSYLPIDQEIPKERKKYILEDSGVSLLILDKNADPILVDISGGIETVVPCDESLFSDITDGSNPGYLIKPRDLAYLIYTSGSTGRPKGVMIEHWQAVNTLVCRKEEYKITSGDTALQLFSYAFDGFITSFFTPLISGARVVLLSKQSLEDIVQVIKIMETNMVTHLICIPVLYNLILDNITEEAASHLKTVTLAGDKVQANLLKKTASLDKNIEIANEYGITEAAVMSSIYRHQERDKDIKIGKPAWNTFIYITMPGSTQNLMPIGVFGEMCLAGAGVARGYMNNPALTAERFVNNPYIPGGKLLKTGDMGRWLLDGNIEFSGRIDCQVKVRGFRIELGEIERHLLDHEEIKDAVVTSRDDARGDKYICAYIISDRKIKISELREHISIYLPDYMIPAYFVFLEKLPLSPTGKVDRNRLPLPDFTALEAEYTTPRNKIENQLVEIWAKILGIEKDIIGIDTNFFELGGNSLSTNILSNQVHKELNVRLPIIEIFRAPNIRSMSEFITQARQDIFASINPSEKKEYYVLSSAQKRLYFLQQMELDSIAYNVNVVVGLAGETDRKKLAETFGKLLDRDESLRTSFITVGDTPVQQIHQEVEFEIQYYEASQFRARDIIENFIRPFDLAKAPILRVGLIKIDLHSQILMVGLHHIITDGISQIILINDFMSLYNDAQLPALRLQYKDYSDWQQSETVKEGLKRQEEFWLKEFAGEIPVLELPTDYTRPAIQSFAGSVIDFEINKEKTKALNEIVNSQGATLFMVLLAVFDIFLSKLSNQDDIVVGTPIAGRRHMDLEQIIGLFINTLALRNYPSAEKTFTEFLKEVKQRTLAAFENQDYPFEELVEKAEVPRDMSRNPIFDVMLILQNIFDTPAAKIEKGTAGLQVKPYEYEQKTSQFDLSIEVVEKGEILHCFFIYCTKIYRKDTIVKFINYLTNIISSVIENPDKKISDIEMISKEEKQRILCEFNGTDSAYPKDKRIHELFEEQVEKTPGNIAVIGESLKSGLTGKGISCRVPFTYRQLNEKSNQLAHFLRARGVKSDAIVGLMIDRSIEMMIGILGILKAGGAYIPIDPNYPAERVQHILGDSNVSFILSSNKLKDSIMNRSEIVEIDNNSFDKGDCQNLESIGQSKDLVYVIYTSGSTGKPKGVMIEHRSLVNFVKGITDIIDFTESDSILSLTTLSFDIFGLETILPLTKGSRVVMGNNEEQLDPKAAALAMSKEEVSILQVTPSRLSMLISSEETFERFYDLKYLLVGGEAFPEQLLEKAREITGGKIYNLYGPTETTIWSTIKEVGKGKTLNIGKPIANTRVYILGEGRTLQPIGVAGELYISGEGLARGYVNNAELTGNKFIVNPYEKEGFLYHTGDIARWLPDGNIEFLGRMDDQVKIKGFRIELGEIESILLKHEGVTEAVTLVKKDGSGDKYLCAYVVLNRTISQSELKGHLSKYLPHYMVPAYFVELEKLPLTPNGKIDRKALPDTHGLDLEDRIKYAVPRNEVERQIAQVWEKVLGRDNIGINDNFFLIGGDSIKAIQIMSRVRKKGYKLEMKDLFQKGTISKLAPLVKKIERQPDQSVVRGTIPLTPIQQHFFTNFKIAPSHFNHSVMLCPKEPIEKETLAIIFSKILEHHDALRMSYPLDGEKILQFNNGLEYPLGLEEYDLRRRDDAAEVFASTCNEIQASINLQEGPLMKVGLFHLDEGQCILIVIHHLVVDGISWRILFEDIDTLYRQYKEGARQVLPLKTDSLKVWAERLSEYANSKTFLKEKSYWCQLEESAALPRIGNDFEEKDDNYVKDCESLSFNISKKETNLLMTKVNKAFGTEINDILLAALGLGLKKIFGHARYLIALESHGREEIFADIDISRTIGWFTSIYPVLLDISYENDLGHQLKSIKETLRKVPNKGIGYGILRYLTAENHRKEISFKLNPPIVFNYLGQFDPGVEQVSFKVAKESPGNVRSMEERREYVLEVSGMTANNQLFITITYNNKQFKPETIESLCNNFKFELSHINAFCSSKEKRELTPADFTYKELSIETVDQLCRQYPIDDLYTLTPMQEGMLFHALYDDSSYSYFEQMSYRLHGELDVEIVKKSLSKLFERHQILRTAFVYEGFERPLQIVLKDRQIDFFYEDISNKMVKPEDKEIYVREFKESDKQRSFDLNKDVLMRVAILKVDGSEYEFTWSFHHILMDGWCIGILYSEFVELYNSYLGNRGHRLPDLLPFSTYIEWLEKQDMEASKNYWHEYLDSYDEVAVVPKMNISGTGEEKYNNKEFSFTLDREKATAINSTAGRNNVTSNTVMQVVWGIILGKYNGKKDVVFGSVVSGRPAELEGVESMVGLFINTVPVRIKFEEKTTFKELLQTVQETAIASKPHHFYPLARIQSESALKQNLIDHILIFENFPIAEKIEGYEDSSDRSNNEAAWTVSDVEVFEQTNYNFNVIFAGSDRLEIIFKYNGNIYDRDYVKRIAGHFCQIIDQIIDNDESGIETLTLLSDEEKSRILYDFNNTEIEYPTDKTIHQLFEKQVERTPDHISVVGPAAGAVHESSIQLTYRQLNDTAGRLAQLLTGKGLRPGTIVGIMAAYSWEMVTAVLGILKAGGAYMPIEPEFPPTRFDYMLNDSRAAALVCTQELPPGIEESSTW